jgi:hypothetical protein
MKFALQCTSGNTQEHRPHKLAIWEPGSLNPYTNGRWIIEIDSLENLIAFIGSLEYDGHDKNKKVIIEIQEKNVPYNYNQDIPVLEIYDDYRE